MGGGGTATAPEHGGTTTTTRPQARLQGAANFKRVNTFSDRFNVKGFHSIEFWCSDATNTYKR